MWGGDPVHPSDEACGVIAKAIEEDILNSEVRYTKQPKVIGEPAAKKAQD
jgi:hypothetical protein